MTSNQRYSPLVAEVLSELSEIGVEYLTPALEKLFNELMLMERAQVLQAAPYERREQRKGYANGFKNKTLQLRCGKLQLQVPKTRHEPFYPSCLEKGMRYERALQLAVAEMYVNGVSTRKVKKITEKLCEAEISSSQVSRLTGLLDEELEKFRNRPLGRFKQVFLDAHYEKARYEGCVRSVAILTAIGINEKNRKEVIGVSCSLSEAEIHWRNFLENLTKRGLCGIELIVSDAHKGLAKAREAVLPAVKWQRCIFHLAQYARTSEMKKEIAETIRDIYLAPGREKAKERIKNAAEKYEEKAPKFSSWLEENFEEGLTYYDYPEKQRKKLRTNNLSERLNKKICRRARVVGVFPNIASLLRLTTAVVVEIHEGWVSERKYLG